MQRPVQITVHDFSLTEPVEAEIRRKAAELDTYYDNILGCKVVVEAPVHHHHRGGPFKVRIELAVPGNDLVVNHKDGEELSVAIREAFHAMRRQLEDYVRQRRGFVKTHEARGFRYRVPVRYEWLEVLYCAAPPIHSFPLSFLSFRLSFLQPVRELGAGR